MFLEMRCCRGAYQTLIANELDCYRTTSIDWFLALIAATDSVDATVAAHYGRMEEDCEIGQEIDVVSDDPKIVESSIQGSASRHFGACGDMSLSGRSR